MGLLEIGLPASFLGRKCLIMVSASAPMISQSTKLSQFCQFQGFFYFCKQQGMARMIKEGFQAEKGIWYPLKHSNKLQNINISYMKNNWSVRKKNRKWILLLRLWNMQDCNLPCSNEDEQKQFEIGIRANNVAADAGIIYFVPMSLSSSWAIRRQSPLTSLITRAILHPPSLFPTTIFATPLQPS